MKFSDYFKKLNEEISDSTLDIEKLNGSIVTELTTSVFLGGTCNNSNWRQKIIPLFNSNIEYFDPVVDDWNEEAQEREEEFKRNCTIELYTITPAMTGVFSIAEVIRSCYQKFNRTVFCVLEYDEETHDRNVIHFGEGQIKSLKAVGEMVRKLGGFYCNNLVDAADFCNRYGNTLKYSNEDSDTTQQISESLIDPALFVMIASLGTAIFTFLNSKLVTDLVMKYGKKVIEILSQLEQKRNQVKKIKQNQKAYEEMINITKSQLLKSGMNEKEAQAIIDATFGD